MRVRVVRHLGWVALVVTTVSLNWTSEAFAVRPFVTDDARIVYKGQLVYSRSGYEGPAYTKPFYRDNR